MKQIFPTNLQNYSKTQRHTKSLDKSGVEKIIYAEAKVVCEIFKTENDRVWKNLQSLQKSI